MKKILLTLLFSLIIIFPNFVSASFGDHCDDDSNCGTCEKCNVIPLLGECVYSDNTDPLCSEPCKECYNDGTKGICKEYKDFQQHGCNAGYVCDNNLDCIAESAPEPECYTSDDCGTCEICDPQFQCAPTDSDPINCNGNCQYCGEKEDGHGICLNYTDGNQHSCPTGFFCSPDSGACVMCDRDDDCDEGFYCRDNNCEADTSADGGDGGQETELCPNGKILVKLEEGDGCPVGYTNNENFSANFPYNMISENKICCQKNTDYKPSTTASVGKLFEGINCIQSGDCSTGDLVQLAINVSKLLTGFVGSVALLFFIIAGIKLIFSAGNEESVKSAKEMMVQTIIGLFIFLGAYLIILFIQKEVLQVKNKYLINKNTYNNEQNLI